MIDFIKLAPSYQPQALSLLTENGLPSEDFDISSFHVIGALSEKELLAMAALELYEEHALLRSVAVCTDRHKTGLGTCIIKEMIKESQKLNLSKLVVLTETAEGFFNKLGFKVTDREKVPNAVRQSKEFQHICPASAVCMTLQLKKETD
ncbi:GNAT family N-acetyltransferase [Fulvivirga sp. 29W222]|uniref:GNAT family N-acetyltransferase n=1 Tax=Fulvivirga marina TaxID=2494733 RepID=A0A937KEB8_9BACT|nr:arsenic resistance N-acetyltransferase ArsN2 [Fulvivirga marina]MBL6449956.1 GNAT family N-acetyltransferase [Fulvivirga marina]